MSIGIQVWRILQYLNWEINLKILKNLSNFITTFCLNPGACQMQFIDGKIWKPLKTWGLYFCHLNVNSSLSKIDELRDITNYIRPVILGITESELNSFVMDAEVNINGYSIIRNDRNGIGWGVACYIRNDLCCNVINIFSNLLGMFFSKFSYQKLNLLQWEYFTGHQMKMIFLIYFETGSGKLTAKPMKHAKKKPLSIKKVWKTSIKHQ